MLLQRVNLPMYPTQEFSYCPDTGTLQQKWLGGYDRVLIGDGNNCPQQVTLDHEEWLDIPTRSKDPKIIINVRQRRQSLDIDELT